MNGDLQEEDRKLKLSLKTWMKLLPYFKRQKKTVAIVVGLMLISALIDAFLPLFTSYAVNHFIADQNLAGLLPFAALFVFVITIQAASTIFHDRKCMELEMNTSRYMKEDCFHHLQELSIGFYNQTSVGYILARVMNDTNRIGGMIAWEVGFLIWVLMYLFFTFISMFLLHVRMTLAVLCLVPLLAVITIYFEPKILRAVKQVRKLNSAVTSGFNESVSGARTSKTLAIEDKNCEEFSSITEDMRRSANRRARLAGTYMPLIFGAGSIAVALVLQRGGSFVIQGTLTYGVLGAFISYAVSVTELLPDVTGILTEMMDAQVNLERVDTLLKQKVSVADSDEVIKQYGTVFEPKSEKFPPVIGAVEFEDVWFRYDDAPEDDWVLQDVNLKVSPGQTVAIVGETGAGKSTLVNLACRFFEPTKGTIRVDGVDYRERSLSWLHGNLGCVQQNPQLFTGSLRDNIRYGRPNATDAETEAAAKLVGVDKIAAKLEDGYETNIGEGGSRLSTGEKQLVAFSRAVLADPPIFVLDEATSSIDTETEKLIQNAIADVLKGRTSFVIAHRLSTIRNADMILYVEGHGITERGTHEELMALGGKYYALYSTMRLLDEAESSGYGIKT